MPSKAQVFINSSTASITTPLSDVTQWNVTAPGDELIVDFSNGDPLPAAGLTFSGGALAVQGGSGNDSATMNGSQITVNGSAPIFYGDASSVSFDLGAGTATAPGENNYAGGTYLTDGTLIVSTSTALPTGGSLFVGADAASISNSATASTPAATADAAALRANVPMAASTSAASGSTAGLNGAAIVDAPRAVAPAQRR